MDGDILEVLHFLALRERPRRSQIILCFGSHNLGTARVGADLYRRGIAPTIVVSGGPAGRLPPHDTEADTYHSVLTESGVPASAVIIERTARHTGENVVLGMAVARSHGIDVRAATLVAYPTAVRRCKATFAHHFPRVRTFAHPGLRDFTSFVADPRKTLQMIDAEIHRLRHYPARGHITPIDIPVPVEEALDRLGITAPRRRRRVDEARVGAAHLDSARLTVTSVGASRV